MRKSILVIASLFLFMFNYSSLPSTNAEMIRNIDQNDGNSAMTVKQQVKGNDVFVECVISNFTFSKRGDEQQRNKTGKGYLQLYLNGKKIDDIYTAAFIIKGVPVGKHVIKLELVHNDGTPYGIEKEFEVSI